MVPGLHDGDPCGRPPGSPAAARDSCGKKLTLTLSDRIVRAELVRHRPRKGKTINVQCVHHGRGSRRLRQDHLPSWSRGPPSSGWHPCGSDTGTRSEEHTSELQSLMRISYAVFCLKKKT